MKSKTIWYTNIILDVDGVSRVLEEGSFRGIYIKTLYDQQNSTETKLSNVSPLTRIRLQ